MTELDGYPLDVEFDAVFARETMPSWLSLALLLAGRPPLRLDRPFRFVDLGSGVGVSAAVVAACHPDAEVIAVDANPAHIEMAREIAQSAGLSNLRAELATFADVAAGGSIERGSVDIVAAHGVYSWVSAANRRHVVDATERLLAPGGVMCVGSLATPGWAVHRPIHALLRTIYLRTAGPTTDRVRQTLDQLARLRANGLHYFETHPSLGPMLDQLAGEDPRHIAHAYLGEHFHPVSFRDITSDFERAGCTYVTSASPSDALELAMPDELRSMVNSITDPQLRQLASDIGQRRAQRIDVFRRGDRQIDADETLDHLRGVGSTTIAAAPEGDVPVVVTSGTVTLPRAAAADLMQRAAQPDASVADLLIVDEAGARLGLEGGLVHPTIDREPSREQVARAGDLTAALARLDRGQPGAGMVVSPTIGSSIVYTPDRLLPNAATLATLGVAEPPADAVTS